MRMPFLVFGLALLLAGCAQTIRDQKLRPGTFYVDSSGDLIEIGSDGKAHKSGMPLDQWPMGLGGSK